MCTRPIGGFRVSRSASTCGYVKSIIGIMQIREAWYEHLFIRISADISLFSVTDRGLAVIDVRFLDDRIREPECRGVETILVIV